MGQDDFTVDRNCTPIKWEPVEVEFFYDLPATNLGSELCGGKGLICENKVTIKADENGLVVEYGEQAQETIPGRALFNSVLVCGEPFRRGKFFSNKYGQNIAIGMHPHFAGPNFLRDLLLCAARLELDEGKKEALEKNFFQLEKLREEKRKGEAKPACSPKMNFANEVMEPIVLDAAYNKYTGYRDMLTLCVVNHSVGCDYYLSGSGAVTSSTGQLVDRRTFDKVKKTVDQLAGHHSQVSFLKKLQSLMNQAAADPGTLPPKDF